MPPNFVFEWQESSMFLFLLGLCALVAIIIHQVLKLAFIHRVLPDLKDVSPVLQTLCGTIFVLSVTFLASNVWQTESRARELAGTEARGLRLVMTIASGLPQEQRDAVSAAAADYARAVAKEWPAMATNGGSAEAERLLTQLYGRASHESLVASRAGSSECGTPVAESGTARAAEHRRRNRGRQTVVGGSVSGRAASGGDRRVPCGYASGEGRGAWARIGRHHLVAVCHIGL